MNKFSQFLENQEVLSFKDVYDPYNWDYATRLHNLCKESFPFFDLSNMNYQLMLNCLDLLLQNKHIEALNLLASNKIRTKPIEDEDVNKWNNYVNNLYSMMSQGKANKFGDFMQGFPLPRIKTNAQQAQDL